MFDMASLRCFLLLLAAGVSSICGGHRAYASQPKPSAQAIITAAAESPAPRSEPVNPPVGKNRDEKVKATIITPYRSAEVGAEIAGVIEAVHFREGEHVKKGEVVVEIAKRRQSLYVRRAENRVKASEAQLTRAQKDAELKRSLLSSKATTKADVLRAEAEAEIARHAVVEARDDLAIATLDLEACQTKAPFTGVVAVSFKQAHETARYLERLFTVVDTSKVYAVASVSEEYASEFKKGRKAVFIPSSGAGEKFTGSVERLGALIDPKSKTKKVFVLIDNSDRRLQIGMTGSLELAQ